jgi:predicted DNA-binding protein YlxM (UPF0122 family)
MAIEDNVTLKKFEKSLEKIRQSLELMKKYGIDIEILEAWLQVRTKLSKHDIQLMLKSTEEFYNKLIAKEMCKELGKEDG